MVILGRREEGFEMVSKQEKKKILFKGTVLG
jgi:hypothetical protein